MNKTKEGITSQKTEYDSLEILAISPSSKYIQTKDKTEIKGIEASTAPQKENFRETSEMPQTRIAEIIILVI